MCKVVMRDSWLNKIRPFYESSLIKVLIGLRRCGKSVVLEQIAAEIADKGIDSSHVIFINFEDLQFSFIKNEMDLYQFVKAKMVDKKKYYLFFDEIQTVDHFEKAINSFKAVNNTSIFITGSNAKLLSGELATLLSGRYVSFRIMPFSFSEACQIQNIESPNDSDLMEYIKWGGMPQRFSMKTESERRIFLSDLYDSIVLKDIITRYKVQNIDLLNRIVKYLATTTSQLFSVTSITNFFKTEKRECSKETLYNYLSYISSSCVVSNACRYDIMGKKQLATLEKYYLADTGFCSLHSTKTDIGAMFENVVFNELMARGYSIQVGITNKSEIDFVAKKDGKIEYYQVAYLLADGETVKREFGAFDSVKDNYPKYVISSDHFDFSRDGIQHKNILEWLMAGE